VHFHWHSQLLVALRFHCSLAAATKAAARSYCHSCVVVLPLVELVPHDLLLLLFLQRPALLQLATEVQ
jgi:hypothetical protein